MVGKMDSRGYACFMQTQSVWLATDPKQDDPFAGN